MKADMCTCASHCTLSDHHESACCRASCGQLRGACECWCHGEIKLFLDDERPTPEGWFRVYRVEEALFWLQSKRVTHLSVDNDLGSLDHKTEGYNVLNQLEEWAHYDPTFPIPVITVHSSNASRVASMKQTVANLERFRQHQVDK